MQSLKLKPYLWDIQSKMRSVILMVCTTLWCGSRHTLVLHLSKISMDINSDCIMRSFLRCNISYWFKILCSIFYFILCLFAPFIARILSENVWTMKRKNLMISHCYKMNWYQNLWRLHGDAKSMDKGIGSMKCRK